MCGCRASICFVGILVSAALLILNCADRRPLQHRPVDPLLFISLATPDGIALDVIDTGTDSILQRIPNAGSPGALFIRATHDGAYLVTFDVAKRISSLDVSNLAIVSSVPTRCHAFCLTAGPTRVVGRTPDSLYFYDVPSLALDTVMPFEADFSVASGRTGEALIFRKSPDGGPNQVTHMVFRIISNPVSVVDSFTLLSPATSGGVIVLSAVTSQDSKTLYFIGYDAVGVALFSFNLDTHTCIFRHPLLSSIGGIAVTPDAQEVWVSQSFPSHMAPPSLELGYILICDSHTGRDKDTITTYGLRTEHPEWPLPIGKITFHPKSEKVYVLSYSTEPALLVIDRESHEIIKTVYGDVYTNVFDMALSLR